MNAQTGSQRRFIVIELPVFVIVRDSLLMPVRYLSELLKFIWIPFAAILPVDVVCYLLAREDVSRHATSALMAIAHFLLFTPFSVAWTLLAIRGPQAVANHPQFSYSRTQFFYLAATVTMVAALAILVFLPVAFAINAKQNFDREVMLLGSVATMLGLGVYLLGYLRLMFVFPAIAVGRYQGIRAAWYQTAGNIERLAAIVLLSYLPFWAVRQVFEWYMGYHPPGLVEALREFVDMLLVALATTALAGPALAYKLLVLDQSQ